MAGRELRSALIVLLVVALVGFAAGCDRKTDKETVYVDREVPVPTPPEPQGPTPSEIEEQWAGSGHADKDAEAFNHWNDDGEVSVTCAKCHSTPGFQDFVGNDGSTPGIVDKAAEIGTTVECDACHNEQAVALDSVTFPSGQHVPDLGPEARCMQCHQGRESTVSVNEHIAAAAPADDDTPDPDIHFRNVHYFAAGVTLYGGLAMGAYQYEGKIYNGKLTHVAAYDTCVECHNVHTLERKVDECANCHNGVTNDDDLRDIRMARSVRDYDGDGDMEEGIAGEVETMTAKLLQAIQLYAANELGFPIIYDTHTYPYWFNDTNGNGSVDAGEASYANQYSHWTARLLKAAYNYQYSQKDPGAFAHNPRYIIAILYDSIESINEVGSVDVPDFDKMWRQDTGHFDATAEAYRHWDQAADEIEPGSIDRGEVDTSCARCHSPEGFSFLAEYGIDITRPTHVSDGMTCETCHVGGDFGDPSPARKFLAEVTFPSGETFENDEDAPDDSFICLQCHQGRESKKSVDEMIAGGGTLSFRNVHYLPAGATLYGSDAHVGYEYDGETYAGKWEHYGTNASRCTVCHLDDHSFEPHFTSVCAACHVEAAGELEDIRLFRSTDYDGDGDTGERLEDEVATFGARLYAAIQDHATNVIGVGIYYDAHTYPYFMKEGAPPSYGNQYRDWDAALLKAAFNYQYWQKEPGAWAHNTDYILQLLYDSIKDLGGDLSGLTRPGSVN